MASTPHINLTGSLGLGNTVLMPGDPLRSQFIAENFLEGAELVNNVRGVQGYTGFYKGTKVSVMASGMGMPSMGIYSYELFKEFDVQNIIRIGSAGSLSPDCALRDIVAGIGVCTDSSFAKQYSLAGSVSPVCSYELLRCADETAKELSLDLKVGPLYSSDVFYNDTHSATEWAKVGCLAVEMESAALYLNAMRLGKRALTICTISDLCYPPFDALDAENRQKTFTDMMALALETAVKIDTLPRLEPKE